ncbi:MAG: type II glyceraldehyde-3-phosphate dehydrogenase [Euryarchaeota archaeon]|nr:type II glyceraldehyde-3-phosphate dehydrogenase [Euryarchaeota archaeon]
MSVKVAINGYGTIGKRVADAVSRQDDMKVIGVVKTRPTHEAGLALGKGFKLYVAKDGVQAFRDAGLEVAGPAEDLFRAADIIVDCTPGKKKEGGTTGEDYKKVYEALGKKAIFQGGEKHRLTGLSFNSAANYSDSVGKGYSRVVSCNTTGLCRTLYPIHKAFGIESVMAVMVRRGADPGDSKSGPINAIEPEVKVPSHHGPDVETCIPEMKDKIKTMAVKVPTTIMHLHQVAVKLKKAASVQDVVQVWEGAPRVMFVNAKDGVKSTAQVMEVARDMGRDRGDLYEIAVWKDGINVADGTLYYTQAIHQESDVVPENVDCIRAVCGLEKDGAKSVAKTNKAMGIRK